MRQVPIDQSSSLCLSFMTMHFVIFDEFRQEVMPLGPDPKETGSPKKNPTSPGPWSV
jgi:hypothetical protein